MNKNQQVRHTSFFNARLTSTISISLVLFILGLIALIGILATEISQYVKENIGFSIVLKDTSKESDIKRLQKELDRAVFVKSAQYITKEEALKELIEDLGENPEEFLGFNPLQASIEVKLNAAYANTDSLGWIEKKLQKQPAIRSITYRADLIQSVNDNARRIGVILGGLAVVLMAISFALISNTIRLNAYSKRFLIHTMKLVGATPGFIRKPFIVSNLINGLVASFLAIAMLTGCVYYLNNEIENFHTLVNLRSLLYVYGIVIVLGMLISSISAFFAVNRYIRMNSDDLYYV